VFGADIFHLAEAADRAGPMPDQDAVHVGTISAAQIAQSNQGRIDVELAVMAGDIFEDRFGRYPDVAIGSTTDDEMTRTSERILERPGTFARHVDDHMHSFHMRLLCQIRNAVGDGILAPVTANLHKMFRIPGSVRRNHTWEIQAGSKRSDLGKLASGEMEKLAGDPRKIPDS
jgi:hypothetical protein